MVLTAELGWWQRCEDLHQDHPGEGLRQDHLGEGLRQAEGAAQPMGRTGLLPQSRPPGSES